MASLIPGYEYDIFISYRQKDNKYDGWVTDFVDNLKRELEATFKEDVSLYFDINPHDGLLETHDVDASLKEKLKCLVFIPILSRTYCDPKSFAWENEFKAFAALASDDNFGLKIRLPGGNVANRVLPVRIHDLDPADIKECEAVLGGVLRGVEFIYREPGINRPVSPGDSEEKNINGISYRNQINKVALAINELISGMQGGEGSSLLNESKSAWRSSNSNVTGNERLKERIENQHRPGRRRWIFITSLAVLITTSVVFLYSKFSGEDTFEKLTASGERISVAVMPFQNMTDDTTRNIWQRWLQYNLINSLSNTEQLMVRQPESIEYLIRNTGQDNSNLTPARARSISRKLDSDIYIYGTIGLAGSSVRIYVQLVESKTEQILKSFQVDGEPSEGHLFSITDSLSAIVKDFLVISRIRQNTSPDLQLSFATTNSPEAFNNYTSGLAAFTRLDFYTSIEYFKRALEADSDFTFAAILLTWSYYNLGQYENAIEYHLKAYEKTDKLSLHLKTKLLDQHAFLFEGPGERIKYLDRLKNLDDQDSWTYFDLGYCYLLLGQYERAIPEFEKALELFDKWGLKPSWAPNYAHLGNAYHQTGQYKKEKKLYRKAEKDFPDDHLVLRRQAILALTQKDFDDADRYIERYLSARRYKAAAEASVTIELAKIFSEAGILDKAESYYRAAQRLDPDNALIMNEIAYFLIDKGLNINEGLQIIDIALASDPGNFQFLDTKGWGFYGQGRYAESLELFQKAWTLKPVYDHKIFLHLEAAQKAVAR